MSTDRNNQSRVTIAIAYSATFLLLSQTPLHAAENYGEAEFKKHCTACHANGGNIIKSDKTLSKKDREKHGITSSKDIIKLMRKPGQGMTTFDAKTVSDKEAKAIADYIIKTFK